MPTQFEIDSHGCAPKEGAYMPDDKRQILEYVADMAQQLADLCREHSPPVAKVLEIAAEFARGKLEE